MADGEPGAVSVNLMGLKRELHSAPKQAAGALEQVNVTVELLMELAKSMPDASEQQVNELRELVTTVTEAKMNLSDSVDAWKEAKKWANGGASEEELLAVEWRNKHSAFEEAQRDDAQRARVVAEELRTFTRAVWPDRAGGGGDDELVITRHEVRTTCPIGGDEMEEPVKARACGHTFELQNILQFIKQAAQGRRGRSGGAVSVKCPVPGCSKTITADDLEKDVSMLMLSQRRQKSRRRQMDDDDDEDDDVVNMTQT